MARYFAFKVTRALVARFLFALHTLVSVWILYAESKQLYYWFFAASPILLFVEAAFTILLRHGDEYKWFCPAVFIFLCGSVPPIWLLELKSTRHAVNNMTRVHDSASMAVNLKWVGHIMFELPQMSKTMWLQVVEQSLLIILILGRWLLPKGRLTRDELSQLLLAYLAISADIVELFNLFQEPDVRMNINLSIMVLVFWSISLVQFPFVITTVKGQKARHCFSPGTTTACQTPAATDPSQPPNHSKQTFLNSEAPNGGSAVSLVVLDDGVIEKVSFWKSFRKKLTDMRIWGILSTILLQDLPFWILRIYLIVWENIMSYTMFFFICKNSLIMCIQLYRLTVICCERPNGKKRDEKGNLIRNGQSRPRYYWTKMSSRFKRRRGAVDDQENKKNHIQLTKEELALPEMVEQNGSIRSRSKSPELEYQYDKTRPSFHITGSVNGRDLMAKKKKQRKQWNSAEKADTMRRRLSSLLPNNKKQQNTVHVEEPAVPKLASPDEETSKWPSLDGNDEEMRVE